MRGQRRGMILSLNMILFLLTCLILLGGVVYGARYMYLSHRLEAIQLQASAIDSALREYAHSHQAFDYTPESPYSRYPQKNGHLYVNQKNNMLNYGTSPEYPMAIFKDGKVANQRGSDNSVEDDGLDFGYFHQKIAFCADGEKPGPNVLYKFLYVPLDRYGNPIKSGNSRSKGFPVSKYALVVAVRSQNGDTLYYVSKGSYPHEQLTKNRPSVLDS